MKQFSQPIHQRVHALVCLVIVLIAGFFCSQLHAESISAGGAEGHYYRSYAPNLAMEVGKVNRTYSGKATLQVTESEGSLDNLFRTANNEAQFGLTQADAYMYFRSTQPNETNQLVLLGNVPVEECVMMVVAEKSKIKEFDDLGKDNTVNIGAPGSGSQASWAYFKKLIPGLRDVKTSENSNILALGDIQTGAVDAMIFVTTKNRSSEVMEMVNAEDSGLKFVDVDDDRLNEKLPNGKPVYSNEKVQVEFGTTWPDKVQAQCMRLQIVANVNNDKKLNEAVVRAIIRSGPSVATIRE